MKSLVNKNMEPARHRAAWRHTRFSRKGGPRAGRLHVKGYLEGSRFELW